MPRVQPRKNFSKNFWKFFRKNFGKNHFFRKNIHYIVQRAEKFPEKFQEKFPEIFPKFIFFRKKLHSNYADGNAFIILTLLKDGFGLNSVINAFAGGNCFQLDPKSSNNKQRFQIFLSYFAFYHQFNNDHYYTHTHCEFAYYKSVKQKNFI